MSRSVTPFVKDVWYFAGTSQDFKPGKLVHRDIANLPIVIGRRKTGELFALHDICPHRAAPLSAGRMINGTVECPYHGWRFEQDSGRCSLIPALTSNQTLDTQKIGVGTYKVREVGALVWVYLAQDPKNAEITSEPPAWPIAARNPTIDDGLVLNCHVDHAVIGLMDPAHGPFVHQQWWWRSEHSIHEKSKAFEPRELGFAMAAHSPSSNSFAYKLLGGKPVTEITFRLPGIRTELIKVGQKTVLSFTAVTPIDNTHTHIRQLFFTDVLTFKLLSPVLKLGARAFLRQDARMVDLQQQGLQHDPRLMLIDDADTQAKWYFALKKEWAASVKEGRAFQHPIKARTLHWRS